MNEKGQFEILSPLIPPFFNIEETKFKELQKLKKGNDNIISNIILELEKSININNNNQKLKLKYLIKCI
jgi:mRNA-degrading endonuclease RelE of RelBE toxin-antitoxin system